MLLLLAFATATLRAADPSFRTDTSNETLPWFVLKPGEFPPEGSAHYIGGELIGLDHINRTGTLRVDRTDAIRRSEWDRALPFTMLAYGSIRFHGGPAQMRDIPIGTHLHGEFYLDEKPDRNGNGPFTRCIRLEDDFSHSIRLHRLWRIDAVDLDKSVLTCTGVGESEGQADPKPSAFIINASTRIWKGREIGQLKNLAAGQRVLVNLTVCTLKGPGRCTDVWIDDESRKIAAAQQAEIDCQFVHDHGLPARVDEVDNQQGTVTVTLFEGFDPRLKAEFTVGSGMAAAVAEDNLRTYDQGSDRMRGDVLEVQTVPAAPGSSGVRIKFKPATLLEGFRPKRILRIFSGRVKFDDIPREERLYQ